MRGPSSQEDQSGFKGQKEMQWGVCVLLWDVERKH